MSAQNLQQKRAGYSLFALNFFMADLQAGIGPFLGVFLLAHGWHSGTIGTVMTIGGVAGMAVTAPAGALIDATRHKRNYIILSALFTSIAAALILFSQEFWVVCVSQVATAIAGSVLGPAVVGITLGIVKQEGFNRQNGGNQAFNHAGNVFGAAMSGLLGMHYGMTAIFLLSVFFGALSAITVLSIPARMIDDNAARGLSDSENATDASGFNVLFTCKPLVILAIVLATFHLGNAAMLPLYGLAAASTKKVEPMMFVAWTIIIAQVVMVITSIVAMRMAERTGYWLVILISCLSLPIRGIIAAHWMGPVGLYPVQMLDGIGAGLQSVAVPGLVAKILDGSGRVNVGQGAVMTMQNIGAALSPAIGGWLAQSIGFSGAFFVLGLFSVISIIIWILYAGVLKAACNHQPRKTAL
ncbi:MFS transporter [Chitinophaga sp.]|uniref:MFS transporter n=1 Tax=Chitinophaga sp. TaxID=1869181 RepID=UPI0031DA2D7B